jgi:LuxR family maltose regulon positive regulatory protein
MSTPILLTKLFIPATRPELVSRSHLIEQLNHGFHNKLTLISAPAGFGKTTLVIDWLHSQGDDTSSPFMVAWLSLDEGDSDVERFLTYLVTALNRIPGLETDIGVSALRMVNSPQPPPPETIMATVINEIALLTEKIILILDDYHLIDAEQVHESLGFLIENLPPQLHLVITTREDPPIQTSRLRARGQLTEIRAVDLRFTSGETAEFLNQVMGLNLSVADTEALGTRTEGWIAGLQLAAISMQGLEDTTGFIQTFTGSNRMILDYLIEEVLTQQSEDLQTFLLHTSILNRLTGSLCNALTGQEDGQATLEGLERTNLFIIPLDTERRWYRYHHLFSELLYQRLKTTSPKLFRELHSKAVTWYETNGELSDAIHHAFIGEDIETAARLIEKGAIIALEHSDLKFILHWVDRLPDETLKKTPWLFAYHVLALLITGQVAIARSKLENTDWLLDFMSDIDAKKQEMVGSVAGLKAILSIWDYDYKKGVDFANQALEYLPANNLIRGYCALVLGSSYWGIGDLIRAKYAFQESYLAAQASGNTMLAVSGGCNFAYAIELEGQLHQALESFQDLFQFAKQDGQVAPAEGYIHVDIARLFYEWNHLELASQHLIDGIKLCQRLADGRAETIGHGLLTRVQIARGDITRAFKSVQNARDANPSPETFFELRGGEFPETWLWLKENNIKKLTGWLDDNRINIDEGSFFKRFTLITHARVFIALGREYPDSTYLDDASNLLDKLLGMAESNGWGRRMIEILVLQALALEQKRDIAQAMQPLGRALTLAEPEGYIRTFVDVGPPMSRLLYEALSREIAPDYVQRILAAFPEFEAEKDAVQQSSPRTSEFIEPLSDRELEVLQLVADGLSRPEIANKLVLSLNTIKTHTRNIYSKLGVNNQMQAVGKARALGILQDE